MAQVDPLAKLQAVAAGGPVAGAEYAAAQKAAVDTKQQALSDAAARSGAIDAPEAFRTNQVARLSAPLDAAAAGLGTQAGAANAYSGAMSAAQGGYLGALNASRGLLEQRMRQQMENPYDGDYRDIKAKLASRVNAAQEAQDKAERKRKQEIKEADTARTDEEKARKEFARQDAAANVGDGGLSGDTYDTIADVLDKTHDLDTALRYIEGYKADPKTGKYLDDKGNELAIDHDALVAYVTKGLDPNAFGELLVSDPKKYGRFAQ